MTARVEAQPRCEDCETTAETTGGWSKPSGTAGSASVFVQGVERADFMLGHPGYLCTRCWWGRNRARRAA